jgi:hypothetical protein
MNIHRLPIILLLLAGLLRPEHALANSGAMPVLAVVPVSAAWAGGTSFSEPMSFNVASNGTKWDTFKLQTFFIAETCGNASVTLALTVAGPGDIINGQFSVSSNKGFSASGQFTSSTTATGNFSFTNYPVQIGSCTYLLTQSGTWTASVVGVQTHKLTAGSSGPNDGWILESSETSNQGGTMNAVNLTFNLGDNISNKQYRAILDFCYFSLPPDATIIKAVLKIKRQGLVGTDPFTTHNKIAVDIRQSFFGNSAALQLTDFQAAASKNAVGLIANNPQVGNWYFANLNASALSLLNSNLCIQFRLRFQLDDNNDSSADLLRFYSGNADPMFRPKLILTYTTP